MTVVPGGNHGEEARSGTVRLLKPAFFGVSAVLFTAAVAATLALCSAMAGMGEVPMAGGWTMSGAWLPMCGQSWSATTVSFLLMWLVMMVAMMQPSLTPALWRFNEALRTSGTPHPYLMTMLAGMGYYAVWALAGIAVFALGAMLASAATQFPALARGLPAAGNGVVLAAGAFQLSRWLGDTSERCGKQRSERLPPGAAWRHGLRLGCECCRSCAAPMVILIIGGVMDLRLMTGVTALITAERLGRGA